MKSKGELINPCGTPFYVFTIRSPDLMYILSYIHFSSCIYLLLRIWFSLSKFISFYLLIESYAFLRSMNSTLALFFELELLLYCLIRFMTSILHYSIETLSMNPNCFFDIIFLLLSLSF